MFDHDHELFDKGLTRQGVAVLVILVAAILALGYLLARAVGC